VVLLIPTTNTNRKYDDCVDFLSPPIVCFGDGSSTSVNSTYYLFDKCTITNTPYNERVKNGISLSELNDGLGRHNFGAIISVGSTKNSNDTSDVCCDSFSVLITWSEVLNGRRYGMQVWTSLNPLREVKKMFLSYRRDETKLLGLLGYLYEEVFGDGLQMMLLVSRYYSGLNAGRKESFNQIKKAMDVSEPVLLIGNQYKYVLDKIDKVFEHEIRSCYNSFQSVTQPLLSKQQVNSLVLLYKTELPHHYSLMKEMFGFDLKENQIRMNHLKETGFYDHLVFYQFLSQARIRFNHNVTHWGMVSAAASYGRGGGKVNNAASTFFGHSTTIKTFLNKTKQWRDEMEEQIHLLLRDKNKSVCCLDNNQKGHPLKYQRFGRSNKFVKVTGSVIKEFISFDIDHDIPGQSKVTYVNQPVPSSYNMPHYELLLCDDENEKNPTIKPYDMLKAILDITASSNALSMKQLYPTLNNTTTDTPDFTGRRVSAYILNK
jgi:hypothetical protein